MDHEKVQSVHTLLTHDKKKIEWKNATSISAAAKPLIYSMQRWTMFFVVFIVEWGISGKFICWKQNWLKQKSSPMFFVISYMKYRIIIEFIRWFFQNRENRLLFFCNMRWFIGFLFEALTSFPMIFLFDRLAVERSIFNISINMK